MLKHGLGQLLLQTLLYEAKAKGTLESTLTLHVLGDNQDNHKKPLHCSLTTSVPYVAYWQICVIRHYEHGFSASCPTSNPTAHKQLRNTSPMQLSL
jgi:hypothetical protein